MIVDVRCYIHLTLSCFYRTRVRPLARATLVTNSLTYFCLVNLTDVTLACEDTNSKLVGVVTVADVDAEDRVNLVIKINFC